MKKLAKFLAGTLLTVSCFGTLAGCNAEDVTKGYDDMKTQITTLQNDLDSFQKKFDEFQKQYAEDTEKPEVKEEAVNYGQEAYEFMKYIDTNIADRDCINGANYNFAKTWIKWNLFEAGYEADAVVEQDFTFNKTAKESDLNKKVAPYTTDGKKYTKSGRNLVEDENGEYVKATLTTSNIVVTKQGKTEKQIIVGMHFDGTGTGDNGSGIALGLITAMKLCKVETEYTLKFVFFSAEEYGCYGSTFYADNMSDEEKANTLYMINMDSLVCGDYCYLYGGVQNDEEKTVTQTEAYDNAMAVAQSLGLEFKSNPWTWDNPAPGYDTPDYASPSTGDWSDHVGFKENGITYLYLEGTNWEIPGPYQEYDGYGETYLIGMLMNTPKDYLSYIEQYFPGRPLHHLTKFSTLLNALLTQSNYVK